MSVAPDAQNPPFTLEEQLLAVIEALAAGHTQQEILDLTLGPTMTALGAVAGTVLRLNNGFLRVAALYGQHAQTVWQDEPLTFDTPAGDVIRSGQPRYFEHAGVLKAAYPQLEAHTGGIAAMATAVLPLPLDGQVLGVLILDFREPHTFTPEEQRFLGVLSVQCSLALGRAESLSRQQEEALARRESEAQLRTSEAGFRTIMEMSPVGMAVGSLDGQLTLVNDSYLHLLGYTRAQFGAGEIDWQLLTPAEYRAQDTHAFEVAFKDGAAPLYEKEMLSRSGARVPVGITLIRVSERQVVGYVQDLRAQQAQQQVLRDEGVRLTRQVAVGTLALEVEQQAMRSFVQFTEAAGQIENLDELARLALNTLQVLIPGVQATFNERTGTHWQLHTWTSNLDTQLRDLGTRGDYTPNIPILLEMIRQEAPVFVDGWDEQEQGLPHSAQFQAGAAYPVLQAGQVAAFIGLAVQHQRAWTEEQRAIIRAVGRSFTLLYDRLSAARELQRQRDEAQSRSQVLELLAALTADLTTHEADAALIRRAQEQVLSLLPPSHAAYWEPEGPLWRLRAHVNDVGNPELMAMMRAGLLLGQTPTLDQPWESGAPLYQDDYLDGSDVETGLTDHVYAVVSLPIGQGAARRGVLNFITFQPHRWSAAEHALLETFARGLWLALERAAHLRQLGEEQAMLQTFVTFTEGTSQVSDLDELARLALDTLQTVLPGSVAVFRERLSDRWDTRQHTNNAPPRLLEVIRSGVPLDTPAFAEVEATGAPVFIENWDAQAQRMVHTETFRLAALYPVLQEGRVRGILTVGQQQQPYWSARDRSLILAVGRSFTLLYDRLSVAQEVQIQKSEAEGRTRALEAFEQLSRDLMRETDRYALIQRALEIIHTLLPPGFAIYHELEHGLWRVKAQVGEMGNAELQRLASTGWPFEVPTLHQPWVSGEDFYQNQYDQGSDTPVEVVEQVNTATTLVVRQHGEPVGLIVIGLFGSHPWHSVDRITLNTARQSLELALERAQSLEVLAEQTQALEQANHDLRAANEELEAFTYSASHDLRTPVRHVQGFTDLALHSMEQPNDKTRRYLDTVRQAANRMNTLIDAMLLLSRAGRVELRTRPLQLADLVTQAQQDAEAEFPAVAVTWRLGALPEIVGDHDTLQQVLTNLLSNAVKYSSQQDQPVVEVWAEETAEQVTVHVRDHGVGFDPAYEHKLFGVFQRLHSDAAFSGTGVGLATVKRIVQRHGGQVFAEGRPGEGATFSFSLPQNAQH